MTCKHKHLCGSYLRIFSKAWIFTNSPIRIQETRNEAIDLRNLDGDVYVDRGWRNPPEVLCAAGIHDRKNKTFLADPKPYYKLALASLYVV